MTLQRIAALLCIAALLFCVATLQQGPALPLVLPLAGVVLVCLLLLMAERSEPARRALVPALASRPPPAA